MKFKLAINRNIVNKGDPTSKGWQNVEMGEQELVSHISNGFAYSPGVLCYGHDGSKPKNQDISSAQLLCIDIDNTVGNGKNAVKKSDEEGYIAYGTAINDTWLQSNALLIYTTPSHSEEHNRFRIIFLLPIPISDPDQYKLITSTFIDLFGADESCKDISRLFFGSKDCEYKIFGNKIKTDEFNRLTNRTSSETDEVKYYEAKGKNGALSPETVSDMLAHIPSEPGYSVWMKAVSAVGNYFDESTAIRIIDAWSPDKDMGTAYKIKHKYANVKIGSLIWLAEQYGYDKSKIYGSSKKKNSLSPDRNISKSLARKAIEDSENNDSEVNENENNYFYANCNQIEAIENYLNDNFDFRFNIITYKIEFKLKSAIEFELFVDKHLNEIWRTLKKLGMKGGLENIQNIINSEFSKPFNPFKEYFENLPDWDGEDYIYKASQLISVLPEQQSQWDLYFNRWLIASVACALEKGINHTCIVLAGEQGIGKTTFWKRLIPDFLLPYYNIAQISPNNKDDKLLLSENFIINLDEMESASRDEIGHLKSLMTIDKVSLRRPYARFVETFPRRASFVGSVNKAMFLTDMTGSRRFLVVEAVKIDYSKIDYVDQIWAQALHLLKKGYKYWFDGEEIQKINEMNEKFAQQTLEEELLLKYFEPIPAHIAKSMNYYSTTEIMQFLTKQNEFKLNINKLGMALKKHSFVREQIRISKDRKVNPKWIWIAKEKIYPDLISNFEEESTF